jgi:hypothetical protein
MAEVQANPAAGGQQKRKFNPRKISALDRPFGGPLRGFIANVERIREYGG